MATQVKHRRGTNAELLAGTPAIGEIWFNTNDNTIHMGDGITPGGIKHINVNISDLVFGTVTEMLSAVDTFKVGYILKTAGRNTKGDGGAANYLVVADNTYTDGVDGHHEGYDYFQVSGFQISLNHNGVVHPEQFGWMGDWDVIGLTGTDNTLSINNMIDYCSPYVYDTSIAVTKGKIGTIRAKIVGGFGIARVTDSVLLNPFFQWEGLKKGAFFGGNSGTLIVGDFDSDVKYVADTAPMITGGSRPLGATYNRADWDGGANVGCPAWKLTSVNIDAAAGRVIKGALNRTMAVQSKVVDCTLGANGGGVCYEGVKNNVCWGGNLSDNHIIGTAYAILNFDDVTTDYQHNNYCTISGTPPSAVNYTYVVWPDAALQDKTACIMNKFSDPHMDSNTHEGGQIGIASRGSNALRETNGYFEAISEYVYAAHSVQVDVTPKWVLCSGAELMYLRGGSTTSARINLQAASYFAVAGWGSVDGFVRGLQVVGAAFSLGLPYASFVELTDISMNGTVNIYVDNGGDDLNSGYSLGNAVLTVQEAIRRCITGIKCVIHLTDGQTHTTKRDYGASTVAAVVVSGMNVEFVGTATIAVGSTSNQTHCLPMSDSTVSFNNVSIDLTGAAGIDNYMSFLRCKGNVTYNIWQGTISGGLGCLIGGQYGQAGHCTLTMSGTTLDAGVVLTKNSGLAGSFSWTETSSLVTDNGAIVGNGSDGKIFSTLF